MNAQLELIPGVSQGSKHPAYRALAELVQLEQLTPRTALKLLAHIYTAEADRLQAVFNAEEMPPALGVQYQMSIRYFRGLARQAKAGYEMLEDVPGLEPRRGFTASCQVLPEGFQGLQDPRPRDSATYPPQNL